METNPSNTAATPANLPCLDPADIPPLDNIQIDDGAPVDGIYSEKQMRLLVEPLQTSWQGPGDGRKFLAMANVGLFFALKQPPLVPDVMVSLDVEFGDDPRAKENNSYFVWILGKPPEVVIEIVSNKQGEEDTRKFRKYGQLGVLYYVIWDPAQHLCSEPLRIFSLSENRYRSLAGGFFPVLGLGLTTWEGKFENATETWLRWCDASGVLIPTGAEYAKRERERAEHERERAERERERADRLADRLRGMGVDPASGK